MPRNAQGFYTLPVGNPVIPGTLIESAWANTTMEDIADALTNSLPRNGSAPMTGPLILSADPIVQTRQATTKAYVDKFMAYSSGMPIGSVCAFGGNAAPAGWLLCDGSAVDRTTYAALFTLIGTTYGAGNGTTTFNVPDLRDQFIRGRGPARAIGSLQGDANKSHVHPIADPGHTHAASQNAHNHSISTGGHSHTINDPGHNHGGTLFQAGSGVTATTGPFFSYGGVGVNGTGISVNAAGDLGGSTSAAQPAVTVGSAVTGITGTAAAGDGESRPTNVAMDYYIKALTDGTGPTAVITIDTSDPQMISIDETNPTAPELVIHSNVAFGTVKLDASGKVPLNQIPVGAQQLLGFFDASGGQNPSQANPGVTYNTGDTYILSVGGTILVYDPVTLISALTPVVAGNLLQYVTGSLTNPTGWYYVTQSSTVMASSVVFTPTGTISANNVQGAIAELDSETQAALALKASISYVDSQDAALAAAIALKSDIVTTVTKDSNTGGAFIPNGSTAERPASPVFGQQRANSSTLQQEWWNGTAWVPMGGGTASAVSFTPAGNIAAANVQAAIQELDAEKQAIPPVTAHSGGIGSQTGTINAGSWSGTAIKIGRLVVLQYYCDISNAGDGGGGLILNGIPTFGAGALGSPAGIARRNDGLALQASLAGTALYLFKMDGSTPIQNGFYNGTISYQLDA